MSAEAVPLKDRYEIRFDQPLPAAAAGSSAYRALDRRSPGQTYAALIPNAPLPIRVAAATAIRGLRNPALWTPLEWGIVDCPPLNRRSWAVIGEIPEGGKLVAATEGKFAPWDETEIKTKLLQPLLPALLAMATERIPHRSIRVDNIWYRDSSRRTLMLGDGITNPPAMDQPVLYEPISSGLAAPIGRGEGSTLDDLYALGVTILHLLQGENPGGDLSNTALTEAKITSGSFAALTQRLSLSTPLGDLCRGLLADNPLDRWTVPDLAGWLEERRRAFKPVNQEPVATRPFPVGTTQCLTARTLARALAEQGEMAAETVRDRGLHLWISRALSAPKTAERVTRALIDGDDGDPGSKRAKLVARVAIALDPEAPIRYHGVALYPDGFGAALGAAILAKDGDTIKAIAEIIHSRLVQFWITCQARTLPEFDAWEHDHERLRLLLADHRHGHGVERLVYELNPRLHCLSPSIETAMVVSMDELLPALELAAHDNRIQGAAIDRHVAGFIASRSKVLPDSLGARLSNAAMPERVLAALAVLGQVQNDHGPVRVRALAGLFQPQFIALANRFHSRSRRRRVLNAADDAADSGRLTGLLQVFEDPDERSRDQLQYTQAAARCAEAAREIRRCQRDLEELPAHGVETAHTMAALISTISSALIIFLCALSVWTV